MTLEQYRNHVADLELEMNRYLKAAQHTQSQTYWDAYYSTKYQLHNARAYLRKKEKKENAA